MNIPQILQELRIEFRRPGEHRHVTRHFIGIDCPWCGPNSGKFKLGIGVNGRGCTCWSCGSRSLVEALVECSGKPWQQVKALLGEYHDTVPLPAKPTGKLVLPEGVGPLLPAHKEYLQGRGFRPKTLRLLWGVQGIGIAPKYPWSLFVPIQLGGKTVSWLTRSIGNLAKRYDAAPLTQEAVPAKSLLYGEQFVRHAVVVVEGVTKAWAGGPGFVATLGTSFTQAQVARIAKYPVRCVCFDGEPEAQRQAVKLAAALAVYPGRTVRVELETARQLDEASPKEISRLRKEFLE
jgi:hypothetical protein